MIPEEMLTVLRYQRERGPLPVTAEGLSGWLRRARALVPEAIVEVAVEAAGALRAQGVPVEIVEGRALASLPRDGDLIDRVLSLAGAPPLPGGAVRALLASAHACEVDSALPKLSLPLRVQPSRASALGWSPELHSLTVLLSNASVRSDKGTLVGGPGPVVAVCAEYDRGLTSLDPPSIASWALASAKEHGVPTVRLGAGWFSTPIRLEATSPGARALPGRAHAVARASRFLSEVDEAWKRRNGPPIELAWPVYRAAHRGPLLDAVVGRPLPDLEAH